MNAKENPATWQGDGASSPSSISEAPSVDDFQRAILDQAATWEAKFHGGQAGEVDSVGQVVSVSDAAVVAARIAADAYDRLRARCATAWDDGWNTHRDWNGAGMCVNPYRAADTAAGRPTPTGEGGPRG